MKKLLIASALALPLIAIAGGINLQNFAAGMQGAQRQQCMNSCQPGDGQCYQACANAYSQPQQNYEPPSQYQQPRQIDYSCVSECTQSGRYIYQYCQSKCSY